jgi:hypothetical protein|tara:strand:- start:681 stop:998 length:318 start_codon:yes stop_codon:yes gene_type:complete
MDKELDNVGPYFSKRFKDILNVTNKKQLVKKFLNMDNIEIRMNLELIFLNPKRLECIKSNKTEYEVRNINRYGYNSTLKFLKSKNIGKIIPSMRGRKKTMCNKKK